MKIVLAMVTLVIVLLTGCGKASPSGSPQTGNPAVYERIAAETDCATLQGEFDLAEHNHHTDYMRAANDRMQQIGC